MLYNLLCISIFSKHVLSNRYIKGTNKTEMYALNKNKIFNIKTNDETTITVSDKKNIWSIPWTCGYLPNFHPHTDSSA